MSLELETQLERILAERLKISPLGLTLTKLQGDASYRIYYRLALPSQKTFIVMKLPEGKASASEEITNLKDRTAEIPFVNVARFLKARGLPVPEIFYADERSGILLLEDFGDETLERRVAAAGDDIRRSWYRRAIELLVDFQERTNEAGADCVAYQRSFDPTLLNWEFDHFLKYGVEERLGLKIPRKDTRAIEALMGQVTNRLVKLPQILVHRDFQSRNLMIREDSLRLLDFQDALMGPLPYDLVALLRDSYIALSPDLIDELIDYYLSLRRTGIRGADYLIMFDLMTIQRKLKDAGRFVYIDRVKGNPSFLKHIPNSLVYVREAFERQKDQKELFDLLKRYVPEWRAS
jgi:aminoglycoside/choline kinase family phosphotransferase